MNRTYLPIALIAALALPFTGSLYSQTPGVPKSTLQLLQEMRAKNKSLQEKQEALLLKLEELKKDASQIKFLTKRG